MTYLLRLSWPSADLSQNARVHWTVRNRATRKAREEAWAEAKARGVPCWPNARLEFEYHPSPRCRMDVQNVHAMTKAAIDGIAQAMGCDDRHFRCVFPAEFAGRTQPGAVLVTITEGGE